MQVDEIAASASVRTAAPSRLQGKEQESERAQTSLRAKVRRWDSADRPRDAIGEAAGAHRAKASGQM